MYILNGEKITKEKLSDLSKKVILFEEKSKYSSETLYYKGFWIFKDMNSDKVHVDKISTVVYDANLKIIDYIPKRFSKYVSKLFHVLMGVK